MAAVAIAAAAIVNFALFAPAYRHSLVEAYRVAPFDLLVNGPMSVHDAISVSSAPGVDRYAAFVDITPLYLEVEDRRAEVNYGRYFDQPADLALLYPRELVHDGLGAHAIGSDGAVLDFKTARSLAVQVGDRFSATFVDFNGDYWSQAYTLTAIYHSSGYIDGSIGALLTADLAKSVEMAGVRYSTIVITSDEAEATHDALEASLLGTDIAVTRTSDLLRQAIANVERLVDPTREFVFLAGATALFALFVAREAAARSRSRAQDVAILIGLGATQRVVVAGLLVEQAMAAGLALVLGSALGVFVFVQTLNLPFSFADLLFVVAVSASLAAVGLAIAGLALTWRLGRLPVAQLLSEG